MECQRCHGMMVKEEIFTEQGKLPVARCVYCGDVVDAVVIYNRAHPRLRLKRVFGTHRFAALLAG